MRITVVGAAMGGLRAAEALRSAGYHDELVVVGEERHRPYNRPPLSKDVLAAGVSHEAVAFPMRRKAADVSWRLGERVTAVDVRARLLRLTGGDELAYDGLVVATGLRPRRLPQAERPAGRQVLRTLDDAAALRASLGPGARVVVVGAGFIGCEVAATARTLGCSVDVVALDLEPMVHPLGPALGAALRERHERHGVRFHLGRTITGIEGEAALNAVVLSDGTRLPADVLVEAIGSRPNVEWLAGNGLDLTDGVLCDNQMRVVGASATVAVGDVARFPNPLFDDEPRRVEHWNIPTETAKRAARTLLADLGMAAVDDSPFQPMPAFWSDQYDFHLESFGLLELADDIAVLEGRLDGEVVVGYRRAGVLVGVAAIGPVTRVLPYRKAIGTRDAPAA